jgi:small nuclear ribonucleoprotein B and B'
MLSLINWRLKVTINDGRALTGQMLAFDRHMNLVLADCEEFRRVRPKKKPGEETAPEQEMKRSLGLVILRGEAVVSLSVEGPPPVVDEDKKNAVSNLCLLFWRYHSLKSRLSWPASCRTWSWHACRTWNGNVTSKYMVYALLWISCTEMP